MKNKKVRAQQIIMTVGCIGFLVWVGFRGMNERQGMIIKEETTTKPLPPAEDEVRIQEIVEKTIEVNQTYTTALAPTPLRLLRSNQSGELILLKVDVNDRIEVGQEIAMLRVAQGDTLGLGKAMRKVKDAKIHVKQQLDLLLAIDRGEDGTEAKEKYEVQYAHYTEAKNALAHCEGQVAKLTSSSHVTYVETAIKATEAGVVRQVLVGAGRKIENNQPLLSILNGQSQLIQIEATSEDYLLVRDHLAQTKATLVFQDQSTYELPHTVLTTLTQKSISEEGKIIMTLNASSIANREAIRQLTLRIPNIPVKVLDEKAIFMRDTTTYIWTLNETNTVVATPVVPVKKEGGKVFVHKGNATWNRVLVGNLAEVKEGEPFPSNH
ncbi:efflux RND transporter periplasmic adaptor subunit [Myroides sp. NP-2]|uniref:efflux RND transporter periplasmic adaptor subunit n=1 Tax=Myroides sp. NP-2 TaxID=2759945 RepID=UPI0015FD0B82|nr:efflux RND transporter periplasmic adaptor subunit [Myroides sp. NP-2]MBB1150768.1 efflux RND transporter periplasmic adaptor subunit [Myroides sp. NP-2]